MYCHGWVSFTRDCSASANFLMNPLLYLKQEDELLKVQHKLLACFVFCCQGQQKLLLFGRKNLSQRVAFLISSQESVNTLVGEASMSHGRYVHSLVKRVALLGF